MEYIVCRTTIGPKNLELTILSLLALREGANYAFLMTHSNYKEQAEFLALVIAGLTGDDKPDPGSQASDTDRVGLCGKVLQRCASLLGGYELAVVKGENQWQVPLSARFCVFWEIPEAMMYRQQNRADLFMKTICGCC